MSMFYPTCISLADEAKGKDISELRLQTMRLAFESYQTETRVHI